MSVASQQELLSSSLRPGQELVLNKQKALKLHWKLDGTRIRTSKNNNKNIKKIIIKNLSTIGQKYS